MNYVILAKETLSSIKSLEWMIQKGYEIAFAVIQKNSDILKQLCQDSGILFGNETDLTEYMKNKDKKPDYLLSYYWKKAGKELLNLANGGVSTSTRGLCRRREVQLII